jgi:hypothetical protein
VKSILTFSLLIGLLASCEKKESSSIEDNSNVFHFNIKKHEGEYDDKWKKTLNDLNVSIAMTSEVTFTISEEDNCTYYIFKEKFEIEAEEGEKWKFTEMPKSYELSLVDEIGNVIYTFNPTETDAFSSRNGEKTYRGKVSKYFSKSDNLTRSKLERTKHYTLTVTSATFSPIENNK